jgi:hypothetical protein
MAKSKSNEKVKFCLDQEKINSFDIENDSIEDINDKSPEIVRYEKTADEYSAEIETVINKIKKDKEDSNFRDVIIDDDFKTRIEAFINDWDSTYLEPSLPIAKLKNDYNKLLFIDAQLYVDKIGNEIKSDITELTKKNQQNTGKIDSMAYIALNLIISFSFVSAAITGIDKISSKNLPLFIMVMFWMCLTSVLFTSSIFKLDVSKINKIIYIFYSIVTIVFVLASAIMMYPEIIEKHFCK